MAIVNKVEIIVLLFVTSSLLYELTDVILSC